MKKENSIENRIYSKIFIKYYLRNHRCVHTNKVYLKFKKNIICCLRNFDTFFID